MAKIQVQGIGVYDDKILKKKIIDMANNLSKLAKKGEWSKSSENGIRALGRMWQAYQDWSRNNESKKEGVNEFMRDTPTDAAEKQTLKNPETGKEVTVRSIMNQGTRKYPSALVKKANAIYDKALEKERKARNKFHKDRTAKYSFRGGDYKREGVNEAGMELNKIKDAILMFQKKIKKQGSVTNARDEDHLKNLIKVYKQMGGKGIKESKLNERITKAFMVHPTDPSQTERHWVDRFEELAQGHGHIIDYGPRESDIYDWNDRRNYKKAIEEYNKYMGKIADGLNKQLNLMNNIWRVWRKIDEKYRKIDKS